MSSITEIQGYDEKVHKRLFILRVSGLLIFFLTCILYQVPNWFVYYLIFLTIFYFFRETVIQITKRKIPGFVSKDRPDRIIMVIIDAITTTFLVYITGTTSSPFILLYIIVVALYAISLFNKIYHLTFIFVAIGFFLLLLTLVFLQIIPYENIFLNSKNATGSSNHGLSVFIIVGIFTTISIFAIFSIIRKRMLEIKSITLELDIANNKLKELDTTKTKFFTNISHEFRTPLTLLISPLESILQKEYGKEISYSNSIFKSMLQNGVRLLKLINNLLDFSKIEAGRMSLEKQNTDIVKLIEYYKSSIQSSIESRGLQIAFYDNTDGVTAYIDRDLIEKAVFNLLSNAMKFTPDRGEIMLLLEQHDEEHFSISVKDTGIGIPEDKLDSIFERFSQVDGTASRKYEGTGIGLSLTKEIVELHGGNISVKSKPGKGSTFTVTLPIGKPDDDKLEDEIQDIEEVKSYLLTDFQNEKPEETVEEESSTEKVHHILIVEDNADMRSFLKALLEQDYFFHSANNGREGFEKAKEIKPDLILSDVMMPEMDGYEFTGKIKTDDELKGIPVILLTAKADVLMKVEGLETGADDYLSKPFNSKELRARIKSQLKMKDLRDRVSEHRDSLQDEVKSQMEVLLRNDRIKKFLPPQLVDSLLSGNIDVLDRKTERKKLTIFFSDIKDFTPMVDKLEPEELSFILNDYLTEMTKIVHQQGGMLGQFIGDAILVYFGAFDGRGEKEDVRACIMMAMDMQKKMVELQEKWKKKGITQPFKIRCGINTGYCTTGNIGSDERMEYTALGNAVNLASRLESAAEPESILISETTKLLAEDFFDYNAKGEIDAKGFNYPVKVFEVVGAK